MTFQEVALGTERGKRTGRLTQKETEALIRVASGVDTTSVVNNITLVSKKSV